MDQALSNLIDMNSKNSSHHFEGKKGIIVDLGTGDGRFVYQSAQRNPDQFYLGIDASTNSLEKLSEKIHRKPAKGGLRNALFIQASVEALPEDLSGIADEVHIHFPWGSLLKGVATGDEALLKNVRKICVPGALLEIIVGIDERRDITELHRLGIDDIASTFNYESLNDSYQASGLTIREFGKFAPGTWPDICTSWAQKLKFNDKRTMCYLISEAT